MRELISIKELAERWNMPRSQVYNLVRRVHDPLPAFKLGGIRIDPAAAEEWLERQAICV